MVTLGVIVGNRGFFPGHLCKTGRETILKVLADEGIEVVAVSEEATRFGAVEALAEARICADLFKKNREKIDGVLVTLPNFGDESAKMTIKNRRDSFCGKMSVCNNLRQYGIKYSLTTLHTVDPNHKSFRQDLREFAATCRVVKNLKHARFGALGARPAAFNTVRYSEKLLEASGISIETLDLSEALGWAKSMGDDDPGVKEKLDAIQGYTKTEGVPKESLFKMAKLGVAIDKWMKDNALVATAIQCWTALEEFYGVVPCTLMSMMSNNLLPGACEVDVAGLVGMFALQSASGRPSALLDWNNNFGDDPDKAVVFHCSNLPKAVFLEQKMDYQEIIAGSVGKESTYGTIVGRIKPGPFTYLRVSTDDLMGGIAGYVGEGRFTNDKLETFGGYGVVEIPRFQELLRYICANGFEHHVAANLSEVAVPVAEALDHYLDWAVYYHAG